MFIPNVKCKVRRRVGSNVYGKPTFGPFENAMCGVVRIEEMSERTSIRADSSASRGAAMEEKILSRILVPENLQLAQGDLISVAGFTLVVQSVWPRFAIDGRQDHWQLDLLILAE